MTTVDDRLQAAASDVRHAADHAPLPPLAAVEALPPRQRFPGWVVAAATAVVVLVAVGGVAWFLGGESAEVTDPTVTTVLQTVTTTLPEAITPTTEAVTPTTEAVITTVPAAADPLSGVWEAFGAAAGLPGGPIDGIATDDSGVIWVLARTDDPATGQLYSLDAGAQVFVARGEPLTVIDGTDGWGTRWMEAGPVGVVVSLGVAEESGRPPERLLQWDEEGWDELSEELDLPDLDMSIAQRSPDGGVRVAGYTPDLGPVTIAITQSGVTYAVAPEGAWGGGGPSVFSIRFAVAPVSPDGRSWFSDGETVVGALDADGYEAYVAEEPSGCCYVPVATDDSGVWAYFGGDLYRYDSFGWRAYASVPIAPGEVAGIVVTADGDVWLLGRYVSARFDPDANDGDDEDVWTVYPGAEAQVEAVPLVSARSAVARDGDAVWVSTWTGGFSIWRHDGREWAKLDIPETIDQDGTGFRQNTVVASSGDLWVATSTGVMRFQPDS